MATTPRWSIPYPQLDGLVAADVPQWLHDLAVSLDDVAKDDQGTLANRPVSTSGSPGKKGRYYFVTGDSTPVNNGVLWRDNGTGWDRVSGFSKTTVSAWSGGPPSSPADGDIWVATGVDGANLRWQFQYDAGSSNASKWEFIGGAKLYGADATDNNTGSTSNVDPANNVSFTLGRAGDYDVQAKADVYNTGGTQVYLAVSVGGSAVDIGTNAVPSSSQRTVSGFERFLAVAAGATAKLQYRASDGTAHILNKRLAIEPVRIA